MRKVFIGTLLVLSCFTTSVIAGETQVFEIMIKNHYFEPAELTVPANERVKLLIKNEDGTSEEFESHELNREKIIPGNSQAFILIDPLEPGEYSFFGEFHKDTALGKLIAK